MSIKKTLFKSQEIPRKPGVYLFRNSTGQVIYVGKAKNLRNRLSTYFQPSRRRTADAKTRSLIGSIDSFEYYLVRNESEALLLESRLIKEYAPFFNVELRDDKRYLLICVDQNECFPRLKLVRLKKNDGRLYFGPFPHGGVLRKTVMFLSKRFGLRTCNTSIPTDETCRHCLDHVIRACSCPCLGKVSAEEYDRRLQSAIEVLKGNTGELIADLEQEMLKLAERHRFEDAAQCRDMLENLRKVCRFGNLRTYRRAPDAVSIPPEDACARLATVLGLEKAADNIECFDISTIGGRFSVGSMVSFRNGRPNRSGYRRFRIREVSGIDDYAMMREVVRRRYARLLDQDGSVPDLVVVDGGRGQLSAAIDGLYESGHPPLPMIALAKQREEIWVPGQNEPLTLARHEAALKLVQALRDEAHRFAIGYHKKLRSQRISDSILTEVQGVGDTRRDMLLKEFGSVKRLRKANVDEICERIPGIGSELARRILQYVQSHGAGAA